MAKKTLYSVVVEQDAVGKWQAVIEGEDFSARIPGKNKVEAMVHVLEFAASFLREMAVLQGIPIDDSKKLGSN